jgi:phosphoribosylanthranilate isomerase
LQLHGDEPEWVLEALLPDAYKAIRIGCAQDLELAGRYGGERILVDAKVPGQLGGTGASFDWSLVSPLSAVRPLVLAGGLTHENVRAAISQVRPAGVDVATGVERPGEPRRKDLEKLARFVEAARQAASDCPKTQAC